MSRYAAYSRAAFALLLAVSTAFVANAQTATGPPTPKIKVYLVGTFHFNGSQADVVKRGKTDMSDSKKQQEIDDIINRLAKSKADKVFVEQQLSQQGFIDSTYALYRSKQFALGNNEVFQVGYRLADKLNRTRVYCADAPGVFNYGAAMTYAKQHGQEKILTEAYVGGQSDSTRQLIQARLGAILGGIQDEPNETLRARLARMNSVKFMQANMDAYMLILNRVGGGNNYVGADLAGEFYKRNMRIYTNLLRTVDVQHDKAIVLIIGAGHVSFLRQQLQYNSLFEVQDITSLLTAK